MTYQADVLALSPTVFLPLGDAKAATKAVDLVGGTSWTVVAGPTLGEPSFMPGDASTSAKFPGTGAGRIAAPSSALLNFTGHTPYTLLVWIKPSLLDNTARRIFSKEFPLTGTVTGGYAVQIREDKISMVRYDASGKLNSVSADVATSLEVPHLLAWTFDGERGSLYLDSTQILDAALGGSLAANEAKLAVGGKSSGGIPFAGLMKDFAAWDGVCLEPDQVADLYQSGMAGRAPKGRMWGQKRNVQIPVGAQNANNQVFRSNDRMICNVKVFDQDTTLHRVGFPFNCENTNFQPPSKPSRTNYGRGNGGRIRVRLCNLKRDGTPDLEEVLAEEEFDMEARYVATQEEFGLIGPENTLATQIIPVNLGGVVVPAGLPVAFCIDATTPEPEKNWCSYNATTSSERLGTASPHNRICLDKEARGAYDGLDPRERLMWVLDQHGDLAPENWMVGMEVGSGPLEYEYNGSEVDGHKNASADPRESWMRLPYLVWQEAEGEPFHQDHCYHGYFLYGTYTLTCLGVPRSCVLREAGGLAPLEEDLGVVTVKNLATGEEASTPHLGEGLQVGKLDKPIRITADDLLGDSIEISHDGVVCKAENDTYARVALNLGATTEWPFSTKGTVRETGKAPNSASMAQLFVLDENGQWPYYVANVPPRRPRRSKPPIELDAEIETHDGTIYRWDANSKKAGKRPQGQNFQTQRGEGFGPGGLTVTRPVMKDHEDLNLLDTVRFVGKNGEVAYEGRVHDFARTNDPIQQFAITTIGWMGTAKFRKFTVPFIDRDQGHWGEPTLARRLQLLEAAIMLAASVSTGAPSTAPTEPPGVVIDFTNVNAAAGRKEAGEAHYNFDDADIDRVLFDHRALNTEKDFENNVALGTSDLYTTNKVSTTYDGTANVPGQSVVAPGPGYKWARMRAMYAGAYEGPMSNIYAFQNAAVIGLHSLPVQGTGADAGLTVSDMLEYIFNNFTPLTWAGQATTYPVKHAAFQAAFPYDAAKTLNDLHLFELGVFENREVQFYPNDLTKYDWQVKTTDPGVRFNPLQGDSIEGFANGVEGTYTDFWGRTHTLYPPDHPELRDETETNPANLHGDELWKDFTAPYPTTEEDCLQMCRAYLLEYNRPKSPGTITIQGGYVRDAAGHWQQGWKLRCGETLSLTNHPNDAPRLITSTPSWDQDSKQLTISVDNGYELLKAFLARQAIGREARNL